MTWDYTTLAASYDKRADYSQAAIQELLMAIDASPDKPMADIGAGTGKLTKMLSRFTVHAVEPNDAMRSFGVRNAPKASWTVGTGEATGLPDSFVYAALFGSSFNVTDQQATLREVARILVPGGWFACMWNHRDLDDPLQRRIEELIATEIPGYSYGSRREDPTEVIAASSLFRPVRRIEQRFVIAFTGAEQLTAWRSHATLQRQAGARFEAIIEKIAAALPDELEVPYTTRIWYAQLAVDKKDWRAEAYRATT